MRLLLALGLDEAVKSRAYQALLDAGPVRMHVLPAEPSRSELDPILNARDGATLVVAGADPGLNTVVTRLVRRGESADLPMAVLPSDGSALGRLLGLPTGITAAARVAVTGEPTRRGLVRDDHGGVLLTGATLSPWQGRRFGARAYTDETEVANRLIRRLAVRPGDGCLRTTVTAGRWPGLPWSTRTRVGRAVTVSCEQARLVIDGITHPRPQTRRTWWYEPDLWQVMLPR